MGVIHQLDDQTINQIAAGEVIERPSSVVKELVENAIDAGATRIRIDIGSDKESVTTITVTDNGCGMEAEDAARAFDRHATSKILNGRDLDAIYTLGFRGEALASIAAVSRVTLTTRPQGGKEIEGTQVLVVGGGTPVVSLVGAPEGTSVRVEKLFFNTPARKKFLKSRQTELSHIFRTLEHAAFAAPEVAFQVRHNSKEQLSTSGSGSVPDAARAILGPDLATGMIAVDGKAAFMQISGLIGPTGRQTNGPRQIRLSINNRPIHSPALARAIKTGYGTLLPKGAYPVAAIALYIDVGLVDVNVHPAKREVRISREKEIIAEISGTIRQALAGQVHLRDATLPAQQTIPAGSAEPKISASTVAPSSSRPVSPFAAALAKETHTEDRRHGCIISERPEKPYRPAFSGADTQLRLSEITPDCGFEANSLPPMRIMGQIFEGYIVAIAESNGTLFLIDQHAAHERILYDLLDARRGKERFSQELLVPTVLHLNSSEAATLRAEKEVVEGEGFAIDEFGGDSFAIHAVPVVLGKRLATETITEILAGLMQEKQDNLADKRVKIAATIVCRAAIKAGTPLSAEQMQRLLDQLSRTKLPWTCPHGRPVLVKFEKKQLDAMFERT